MIIYESKRKFFRPHLLMEEKKFFKSEYHQVAGGYEQRGVYSTQKCTVKIDVMVGWLKDRPNLVILECDYNGHSYQRNYDCTFSDRGFKLIAAKFVKDILSGKIKAN